MSTLRRSRDKILGKIGRMGSWNDTLWFVIFNSNDNDMLVKKFKKILIIQVKIIYVLYTKSV